MTTVKLMLSFLAGLMVCHLMSCNKTSLDMNLENVNYTESTMSVLFFTSPTCSPCVQMKKSVWPHPAVMSALTVYKNSPKMLDSANKNDAKQFYRYNIEYVPATIVVDHEGLEDKRYVGYMDVETLVEFLD